MVDDTRNDNCVRVAGGDVSGDFRTSHERKVTFLVQKILTLGERVLRKTLNNFWTTRGRDVRTARFVNERHV
jgi:hypothetical protein